MFSTVWQVFCWQCISVCLLFRCFALPPWFLTQSGFEKGDGTYQLLATVTSFQLEKKMWSIWAETMGTYGNLRMLTSSILPYVCLLILSSILHLFIFLHFEVAPTWSYPVFDLAGIIIIMDLCLSFWVVWGLASCPRSLENSWLSGTWQVHCLPLSGIKPSTFTSVPEPLCLYLAYFISEYFKGDSVSNPLDFQHNPAHFSLVCSLKQNLLLECSQMPHLVVHAFPMCFIVVWPRLAGLSL